MIDEFTAVVCSAVLAEHGEGVVWDQARGELLWVDVGAGRLHRGRPGRAAIEYLGAFELGCPLGAIAPAQGGGWIAAAGPGFARLEPDGVITWVARPAAGQPEVRMNDGACDPAGRFWAGTMAYAETPGAGTLYRLDPDGATTAMLTGTTISNGLGWSIDGHTLWFADSGDATVDAFDFDPQTGGISGRRTVVEFDPSDGVPDGLVVDAHDHVWVAVWNGGEVRRYSPDGDLVARVHLPVSRPTSCCFGGPELDSLFISTARKGLPDDVLRDEPDAGRLFSVQPGTRGVAQPPYAAHLPRRSH